MKTKTRKQRGSRTHGWGAGKKHRGAGHRGGRGNAGSGKRGQQRETKFLAKGITVLGGRDRIVAAKSKKVINLREVATRLKGWEKRGFVKKVKNETVVDLKAIGYDKLLGVGDAKDLKGKKIIIDEISESARKKLGISRGSEAGEVTKRGTALRGEE